MSNEPRSPEEVERLINERIAEAGDGPNVHALPTRPDQLLAAVHDTLKIMRELAAAADEVAEMRKRMFDAYLKAGFTPEQAITITIQRQPI